MQSRNDATDSLRRRARSDVGSSEESECEILADQVLSVAASSDSSWWPSILLFTRPDNVLSPDPNVMWNARSFAPAWIRFDLGRLMPCVSRMDLLPSMQPDGFVVHRIRMGMYSDRMEEVARLSGMCSDRTWIRFRLPHSRRARYVEVMTVESPSWVAWIQIRLWQDV